MNRIQNTESFIFWKFYEYWMPNYSFLNLEKIWWSLWFSHLSTSMTMPASIPFAMFTILVISSSFVMPLLHWAIRVSSSTYLLYKLFDFWKWRNTEYWIVLLGLNYLNTEYSKLNSSPPKNFICEICDQMRWGKFHTLFSYLHQGIWIVHMNSTIRSQLFEYRLIRIIRSNSVTFVCPTPTLGLREGPDLTLP